MRFRKDFVSSVFVKITAWITLAAFLSTTVGQPAAQAFSSAAPTAPFVSPFISPDKGIITESLSFDSGTAVLLIQDLHCHPGVQKNIAGLLADLDRSAGLNDVFVEGNVGPVDTSWIELFPAGERKDIIETLLSSGRLTGAEYYALTGARKDPLLGLENASLFKPNLVRMAAILRGRQDALLSLAEARRTMAALKSRWYTPANKRLDRLIHKYGNNTISEKKFSRSLTALARKAMVDMYRYDNLRTHVELSGGFAAFSPHKVSKELNAFLESLKKRLPYKDWRELQEKTGNFSDTGAVFTFFSRLPPDDPLFSSPSYSRLARYLSTFTLSRSLNPLSLVAEQRGLIRELQRAFSATASEREVAFLDTYLRCLVSYAEAEVTFDDYRFITENRDSFEFFWGKYTDPQKISSSTAWLSGLDEFYRVNVERNNTFLASIGPSYLAGGSGDGIPSESIPSAKNRIAVVTGGFHTQELARILAGKKVSYAVITPRVPENKWDARERFEQILLGNAARMSRATINKIYAETLSAIPPAERETFIRRDFIEGKIAAGVEKEMRQYLRPGESFAFAGTRGTQNIFHYESKSGIVSFLHDTEDGTVSSEEGEALPGKPRSKFSLLRKPVLSFLYALAPLVAIFLFLHFTGFHPSADIAAGLSPAFILKTVSGEDGPQAIGAADQLQLWLSIKTRGVDGAFDRLADRITVGQTEEREKTVLLMGLFPELVPASKSKAVDHLYGVLADPDAAPEVHAAAVASLLLWDETAGMKALDNLSSKVAKVRGEAIDDLETLYGYRFAVPSLRDVMDNDSNWRLRRMAALAIAGIQKNDSAEALQIYEGLQKLEQVINEKGRFTPQNLGEGNETYTDEVLNIIHQLSQLDTPLTLPAFISLLGSRDQYTIAFMVFSVLQKRSEIPSVRDTLTNALLDEGIGTDPVIVLHINKLLGLTKAEDELVPASPVSDTADTTAPQRKKAIRCDPSALILKDPYIKGLLDEAETLGYESSLIKSVRQLAAFSSWDRGKAVQAICAQSKPSIALVILKKVLETDGDIKVRTATALAAAEIEDRLAREAVSEGRGDEERSARARETCENLKLLKTAVDNNETYRNSKDEAYYLSGMGGREDKIYYGNIVAVAKQLSDVDTPYAVPFFVRLLECPDFKGTAYGVLQKRLWDPAVRSALQIELVLYRFKTEPYKGFKDSIRELILASYAKHETLHARQESQPPQADPEAHAIRSSGPGTATTPADDARTGDIPADLFDHGFAEDVKATGAAELVKAKGARGALADLWFSFKSASLSLPFIVSTARTMWLLGDRSKLIGYLQQLNEADVSLRREAVQNLGILTDPELSTALLEATMRGDPSLLIRAEAAIAVADIRKKGAIARYGRLILSTEEYSDQERRDAVEELGNIRETDQTGETLTGQILIYALMDSSLEVSETAYTYLMLLSCYAKNQQQFQRSLLHALDSFEGNALAPRINDILKTASTVGEIENAEHKGENPARSWNGLPRILSHDHYYSVIIVFLAGVLAAAIWGVLPAISAIPAPAAAAAGTAFCLGILRREPGRTSYRLQSILNNLSAYSAINFAGLEAAADGKPHKTTFQVSVGELTGYLRNYRLSAEEKNAVRATLVSLKSTTVQNQMQIEFLRKLLKHNDDNKDYVTECMATLSASGLWGERARAVLDLGLSGLDELEPLIRNVLNEENGPQSLEVRVHAWAALLMIRGTPLQQNLAFGILTGEDLVLSESTDRLCGLVEEHQGRDIYPETIDALIYCLKKENDTETHNRIVSALQMVYPEDRDPRLAHALNDVNPMVRLATVLLIQHARLYACVPAVRQLLRKPSENPDVQAAACECLGELRDKLATGLIIKQMRSRHSRVCAQAAAALIKLISPEDKNDPLKAPNYLAAEQALLRGLIPPSPYYTWSSAARALVQLQSNDPLAQLLAQLIDGDRRNRIRAVDEMTRSGDRSYVPYLKDSFTYEPDEDVKAGMVTAIGALTGPDDMLAAAFFLGALKEILRNYRPPNKIIARLANVLGDRGYGEAIPYLVRAANTLDPEVHMETVTALKKLGINPERIENTFSKVMAKTARGTTPYGFSRHFIEQSFIWTREQVLRSQLTLSAVPEAVVELLEALYPARHDARISRFVPALAGARVTFASPHFDERIVRQAAAMAFLDINTVYIAPLPEDYPEETCTPLTDRATGKAAIVIAPDEKAHISLYAAVPESGEESDYTIIFYRPDEGENLTARMQCAAPGCINEWLKVHPEACEQAGIRPFTKESDIIVLAGLSENDVRNACSSPLRVSLPSRTALVLDTAVCGEGPERLSDSTLSQARRFADDIIEHAHFAETLAVLDRALKKKQGESFIRTQPVSAVTVDLETFGKRGKDILITGLKRLGAPSFINRLLSCAADTVVLRGIQFNRNSFADKILNRSLRALHRAGIRCAVDYRIREISPKQFKKALDELPGMLQAGDETFDGIRFDFSSVDMRGISDSQQHILENFLASANERALNVNPRAHLAVILPEHHTISDKRMAAIFGALDYWNVVRFPAGERFFVPAASGRLWLEMADERNGNRRLGDRNAFSRALETLFRSPGVEMYGMDYSLIEKGIPLYDESVAKKSLSAVINEYVKEALFGRASTPAYHEEEGRTAARRNPLSREAFGKDLRRNARQFLQNYCKAENNADAVRQAFALLNDSGANPNTALPNDAEGRMRVTAYAAGYFRQNFECYLANHCLSPKRPFMDRYHQDLFGCILTDEYIELNGNLGGDYLADTVRFLRKETLCRFPEYKSMITGKDGTGKDARNPVPVAEAIDRFRGGLNRIDPLYEQLWREMNALKRNGKPVSDTYPEVLSLIRRMDAYIAHCTEEMKPIAVADLLEFMDLYAYRDEKGFFDQLKNNSTEALPAAIKAVCAAA